MTSVRFILVTLTALALSACDKPQAGTAPIPAASSPRPSGIPAAGALTLATGADMKTAAQVASDPAIQKAVGVFLGSSAARWKLVAARPIGNCILLWISFPDIADGGTDLVYSTTEQRIGWEFSGGYRG